MAIGLLPILMNALSIPVVANGQQFVTSQSRINLHR
jgi:hypothetical protein